MEFSLTDDREGKTLFFHFDLYNLSGLQDILRENTFIETDHPDHATFLHKAKALERGEISYFIGALHYPDFMPDLAFCNQILTPECTLLELKAPHCSLLRGPFSERGPSPYPGGPEPLDDPAVPPAVRSGYFL